jgi:flagellin
LLKLFIAPNIAVVMGDVGKPYTEVNIMQINHNISAMVTQHALYQNNNSMSKSLEKLSTGLRINRAQDDAAGLAMSEQMRSQIRGLGKAKQNSQDGIAALQIAEGALGEITNMMHRQKELAVQAANDTLTSTERFYLDDEFQALTKEMDRIAKTTDYNGKNVLIFNQDPNLSFGATKLNPYNREVSYMDSAKTLYDSFNAKLSGDLGILGGDDVSNPAIDIAKITLHANQIAYSAIADAIKNAKDNVDSKQQAVSSATMAQVIAQNNRDVHAAITGEGVGDPQYDALNAILTTATAQLGAANAQLAIAQTALSSLGNNGSMSGSAEETNLNTAKAALDAAKAPVSDDVKVVNDAISAVNKVISDLNGIPLDESNIKEILEKILRVGDIVIPDSTPERTFGGDSVYANVLNAFSDTQKADLSITGLDEQVIKDFNLFLRNVRDAYDSFCAAEVGDPKYGSNGSVLDAAHQSMADTLNKLFNSDNKDIVDEAIAGSGATYSAINSLSPSANYVMLANAANSIIERLNQIVEMGDFNPATGVLSNKGITALGGIFSATASPQMKDAVQAVLAFDVSKMTNGSGLPLAWDSRDKQIALAIQKAVSELNEAYTNYSDEVSYPVGTAASEILHVSANYSHSLGGKEASEIMVNYVEVNVKNLGVGSQCLTEQAHATRAIDRIDEVIKVVSGNRAAIGTYINRLEYTINNIASMTYNTQEAESRIRDTDFSKETTEFTKNQIMVQSATSILAQANTRPQAVLGLLG